MRALLPLAAWAAAAQVALALLQRVAHRRATLCVAAFSPAYVARKKEVGEKILKLKDGRQLAYTPSTLQRARNG